MLSHFLPQMVSREVDSPALINIDNHDFEVGSGQVAQQQNGQLFFQAVVDFKDSFTAHLPANVQNKVHSITLKVDFNQIPVPVNGQETQDQLCYNAFKYLNIKPVIYAQFKKQKNDKKADQ